jgi:hypothetical protein
VTVDAPRERCAALIALFDQVTVGHVDYQILMLEDHELAETRELRRTAETECLAVPDGFGVEMIETALPRSASCRRCPMRSLTSEPAGAATR